MGGGWGGRGGGWRVSEFRYRGVNPETIYNLITYIYNLITIKGETFVGVL